LRATARPGGSAATASSRSKTRRPTRERPGLARALGAEEGQLAAAGVRAHEGELVGAVDHVHAHVAGEEVRERVAVLDPESDVIERLDLHGVDLTHTPKT
jgi:hypothetical protein